MSKKKNSKKGKRFSEQEKASIVKQVKGLIKSGKTEAEACKAAQVSTTSYYRWRDGKTQVKRQSKLKKSKKVQNAPNPKGSGLGLMGMMQNSLGEMKYHAEQILRIVEETN